MIPVVYIHTGETPKYLIKSLVQATKQNREVILVTDKPVDISGVRCLAVTQYSAGISEFAGVYRHMSTLSPMFELLCIQRWFVLRNVVNALNLDVVYYTDSDVMIYDDLAARYELYRKFDASFVRAKEQDQFFWAASGCCSYWKRQALAGFCDMATDIYSPSKISKLEEKWRHHQKHGIPGGVCDMTLLYLYSLQIQFQSLSEVVDGVCFDQNHRIGDNYLRDEYEVTESDELDSASKKIVWKDGFPWAYNRALNVDVRFAALTEFAKMLVDAEQSWLVPRVFARRILRRIRRNR